MAWYLSVFISGQVRLIAANLHAGVTRRNAAAQKPVSLTGKR